MDDDDGGLITIPRAHHTHPKCHTSQNPQGQQQLQQLQQGQEQEQPEQEQEQEQQQQQQYQQQQLHQHQRQHASIFPSELIVHIFRFLTAPQDLRAAILVCKLWCSCGVDMLWSRPHLLSMQVVARMTSTLASPNTLFAYARYIRRLNFSFLAQDLTDASLAAFANCVRLERLLLPASSKTTKQGLEMILANRPALYSLDLSDVIAANDDLVHYIAQHCPRLHTLYLASCATITDDAIVALAKSCRSLKRIKLSQCTLLTERSIIALTQHCPHLMEVDLSNCSLVTNNAVQAIFKTLPQVRDVNLTLLSEITDASFSWILPAVHRFEQLRILNLTSCALITDETLFKIIPAAPRLRSLILTKCDRITDAGASIIKTLGKHLHYLHLGHCSKLTDKTVLTLAQHCTRIRYLDLACCSRLTDAAVFSLAQLPKLRRIGLVKCSNITDHGIYAMLVSQVVPQTLERVHLSYCIHLSDTAVAALVNRCTKLTHLSLTGVPSFMTPRYQKFCRVPPSEFTAHQREVFCVFSGKGVRELRHYMQENPAMGSSASMLPLMRHNYRIAGATVASMVAGGPHSSAILSHLNFNAWPSTDDQVQSLDIHNASMPGTPADSQARFAGDTTRLTSHSTIALQQSLLHQQPLLQQQLEETLDAEDEEVMDPEQENGLDNDDFYLPQTTMRHGQHQHHHQPHPYPEAQPQQQGRDGESNSAMTSLGNASISSTSSSHNSTAVDSAVSTSSQSPAPSSSSSSTRARFMAFRSRNRRSHTLQGYQDYHQYYQHDHDSHLSIPSTGGSSFRTASPTTVTANATASGAGATSTTTTFLGLSQDHESDVHSPGHVHSFESMDCSGDLGLVRHGTQDVDMAPVQDEAMTILAEYGDTSFDTMPVQ
ncbi:SCF ubiquitin ligase complex subunit [Podila epigama]|nr:SCF ubiquitin ligase complex subunit [Podila epigama]